MLENIDIKTIERIFAALPVEISFVDSEDRIAFFNEGDNKIFPRRLESIGKDVYSSHPERCLPEVIQIIDEMRKDTRESAEYWINKRERFLHIRYFAVRDKNRKYLGVVEVVQDITEIKRLEGEKRIP
ncbi:PAS domain-containing protein [bacterium]|nr:PAS domain-containing protein [bacterium]